MPGDVLFRIADHSRGVGHGRCRRSATSAPSTEGQPSRCVRAAIRTGPSPATVALVYPHLNPATRTVRVRIELPNADHCLAARTCMPKPRSTPAAASRCWPCRTARCIDSGDRQIVIVDKGEGRFEPRAVKLGRRGAGYVEIRDGVKDGELVVTSANFLIDAESNLKAALKGLTTAGALAMIARLIAASARNIMLVMIGTVFAVTAGLYAIYASAARCHPRPLRYAGHRLHRVSGPGAAGGRGPGHLSADHGDAHRAEVHAWCAASRISGCRSST